MNGLLFLSVFGYVAGIASLIAGAIVGIRACYSYADGIVLAFVAGVLIVLGAALIAVGAATT
jgi:hypothetical protein